LGGRAAKKIHILHDPFGKVLDLGVQFSSDVLVILDPVELRVAIIGTAYAGEIKKAAFSLCNYWLPHDGILPMHASANCLEDGSETTLLFGLSGTGKTTLSASPDRLLIGDDEIAWGQNGIFNLEGGCYAKLINLNPEREPEIYRACNRFGAILENVVFDAWSRRVDFDSAARTENTRGSYSLREYEKAYAQNLSAEAPRNIVFLLADAFGATPAVARLDPWQAQYHFLAGYTAKVAGTEMGVREPKATFSACFGEPFMPLHPTVYSEMLARFSERCKTRLWLLNTGWTNGGYGKSSRFPLTVTRSILSAIQSGDLERQRAIRHPIFGFEVPQSCPGVDSKWLEAPMGAEVRGLARKFIENMRRFDQGIDRRILEGGPTLVEGMAAAL
jgi:phosphoenolpyruvate carboxykinase (ATP)